MPEVSIELDGADALQFDLRDYPPRADRILVRGLNRGGNSMRTFLQREISRDMGLQSNAVRDVLVVREATLNRPEFRIAASLERIPLIKFGARGPEPSRGRGRGVTYRLPGVSRQRNERAFIATMPSGHRGVFQRMTRARLPITELHGPSIGRVFAKFRDAALARGEESFRENLDHDLSRLRD